MSTRQAPFYPNITLETTETRFGALETNMPNLYDQPIKGQITIKIDTLDILCDIWGENILMSRDKVYTLLSGNTTDERYRAILMSYYRKYAAFCNYVTDKYIFGDSKVPLIRRIVEPARCMVNEHAEQVKGVMKFDGCTYLMQSHDYLYYLLPNDSRPKIRGAIFIC